MAVHPSAMTKNLTISSLIVVFVGVHSASAAQAPAPGVAAGERIGNVVRTAISTAAPGLGSLLDLIWGRLGNPNANKATKAELKTAGDPVSTQIKVSAQQAITPLGRVADELAVIVQYLDPTVTASQNLIVMRTKAADAVPDWVAIANQWELAKIQIAKLKAVPDADVRRIRDLYLRDRLSQIRNANDTVVVAISQDITNRNVDNLKGDVPVLLSTLANMTAVAGYEFAELQADIKDLSDWARGAAGGRGQAANSAFKGFLDAHAAGVAR